VIVVPPSVLEAIRGHGGETYPEECCGALLGQTRESDALVTRAERILNASREMRERRFSIDPRDYLRLERRAEELGLSLLGFYHSHPDHPAAPSAYDREHALPFLHYLIVAVDNGRPGEATSWVLSEDRGAFEREELRVGSPGE
jgi:proteasome lid subunit RPN8/RPN11